MYELRRLWGGEAEGGLENKKNKLRNILTSTLEFINTLHAN